MNNWIYVGLGVAGLIAALFFEESREWIIETFEYIIAFEWLGDIWDLISSGFEDMGDISYLGLAFGLIGSLTIFFARDYMLQPFLVHMGGMEAIIWGTATYIGTFIAGYLLGKGFENTG